VGLAGDRTPKGAFHYSNVGYWLLGSLLEPLGETLMTEVFEPAGMATTCYPHAIGDGVTESGYDTLWAGPAGATWCSAADVTLFLRRLFDGTLLTESSLAEMTTGVPVADAGDPWVEPTYGLGLMLDAGLGIAGHGGGGPSFTSAGFIALAHDRAAAAIARSDSDVDPLEAVLSLIR
jgi:CubicO group peptidase (beta-lactamase class C family)